MYNKQGHVCKEIINVVRNSKVDYKKGQFFFQKSLIIKNGVEGSTLKVQVSIFQKVITMK